MRYIIIALLFVLLSAPSAKGQSAADSPVILSDAQSFEASLSSEMSYVEIADARRAMASAVSAEKFIDGVKTAFFVAFAAYGAYNAWWADSSTSTTIVQQVPVMPTGGI